MREDEIDNKAGERGCWWSIRNKKAGELSLSGFLT
jgi:hypothetical protein